MVTMRWPINFFWQKLAIRNRGRIMIGSVGGDGMVGLGRRRGLINLQHGSM
jgi:hypothetical protein